MLLVFCLHNSIRICQNLLNEVLITILISLNGKFNVSRKNKYAWVHKRTKQTVKELMKADSPINNPWVKERRNKKKSIKILQTTSQ